MNVLWSAYVAAPLIQETGARRTGFKRCLYNAVLLIAQNLKVALIFMRFFSLHSDLGNVRINLAYLTTGLRKAAPRAGREVAFTVAVNWSYADVRNLASVGKQTAIQV